MADIKMRHGASESSNRQIVVREDQKAEYEAEGWVEVGEGTSAKAGDK